MRVVVQRVRRARVTVGDEVVGEIGPGLLVLLGVTHGDTIDNARWLAEKTVGLRIFADDEGKMNRALGDVGGGLLVVSQFTLFGDTSRGRRPSYADAMPPEHAERLYQDFVTHCGEGIAQVATGRFGADMRVVVDNDGPVTLLLDTTLKRGEGG